MPDEKQFDAWVKQVLEFAFVNCPLSDNGQMLDAFCCALGHALGAVTDRAGVEQTLPVIIEKIQRVAREIVDRREQGLAQKR